MIPLAVIASVFVGLGDGSDSSHHRGEFLQSLKILLPLIGFFFCGMKASVSKRLKHRRNLMIFGHALILLGMLLQTTRIVEIFVSGLIFTLVFGIGWIPLIVDRNRELQKYESMAHDQDFVKRAYVYGYSNSFKTLTFVSMGLFILGAASLAFANLYNIPKDYMIGDLAIFVAAIQSGIAANSSLGLGGAAFSFIGLVLTLGHLNA
jgi:hypothetical protein